MSEPKTADNPAGREWRWQEGEYEVIRGLECEPAMIAQTADVLIYDRADRTGELPDAVATAIWNTSNALFGGRHE